MAVSAEEPLKPINSLWTSTLCHIVSAVQHKHIFACKAAHRHRTLSKQLKPLKTQTVAEGAFWSTAATSGLGAVFSDIYRGMLLTRLVHSVLVLTDIGEVRQVLLKDDLSLEGSRRKESVVNVTAWAWLEALPGASRCLVELRTQYHLEIYDTRFGCAQL